MLKKALLGYIAAILFISFLISIGLAKAYNFQSYSIDDGSANNNCVPPSFYLSGGSCTVNSSLYVTATATGPFYLSNTWYSPDSTAVYTSLPFSAVNLTCAFVNTNPSVSASNNSMWESGTSTVSSATVSAYLKNNYACTTTGDVIMLDNTGTKKDSFNYFPFGYRKTHVADCHVTGTPAACADITVAEDYLFDSMAYADCGEELNKDKSGETILPNCNYGASASWRFDDWYYIPFNSGPAGMVNITVNSITTSVTGATGTSYTYDIELLDTVLNSTTALGTSLPYSAAQILVPNRNYWLMIDKCGHGAVDFTTGPAHATSAQANYSISIYNYEPQWNCSECEDGYRICIDPLGKALPFIDSASCIVPSVSDIAFLNNLGFEASTGHLVSICGKDWVFGSCPDVLHNITADFPVNWTVSASADNQGVYRENYMAITSEGGAKSGSKALKMWYIPIKPSEPINDGSDGTICGNMSSSGRAPEVDTPYNSTLFVAANISFPSPFMDLRYSVKSCANVPIQYDYTGDLFNINCGKLCVGYSCNETPQGKYGIRLVDTDSSIIILDITGPDAKNAWKSYVADLSGLGIQANHNYTLAVAVNPFNLYDAHSSCIYFDKIQVTMRNINISDCSGYCDDNLTRYEPVSTNPCLYEIAPSGKCVSDAIKSAMLDEVIDGSRNSTCIGNDSFSYNANTGELIVIRDAPFCVSESQGLATGLTLYDPPQIIADSLLMFGLSQAEYGYIWFFFSIFMLINYMALAFGIAVIYLITLTQKNLNHIPWEFGAITMAIIIVGALFAGWYPLEIGIPIIVLIGLMLYFMFGGKFGGGRG